MSQIADLVSLRRFTAGRAAFAVKEVQDLAIASGDTEIAEEAAQANSEALKALKMRRNWRGEQNAIIEARGDGQAVELDNQQDRLIASLHTIAQGFIRSMPKDSEESQLATELVDKLYPRGVAAITSQPFEDEAGNVQVMLAELKGPLQSHVQKLGLSGLVERLDQVNGDFRQSLKAAKRGELSFDKVNAQENLVQERLSGLVLLIAAKYRSSDAASISKRSRLLAPILDQNERILDLSRRRRTVTDVNPDTGTESESLPTSTPA